MPKQAVFCVSVSPLQPRYVAFYREHTPVRLYCRVSKPSMNRIRSVLNKLSWQHQGHLVGFDGGYVWERDSMGVRVISVERLERLEKYERFLRETEVIGLVAAIMS